MFSRVVHSLGFDSSLVLVSSVTDLKITCIVGGARWVRFQIPDLPRGTVSHAEQDRSRILFL